jgi:hypothetical protein
MKRLLLLSTHFSGEAIDTELPMGTGGNYSGEERQNRNEGNEHNVG